MARCVRLGSLRDLLLDISTRSCWSEQEGHHNLPSSEDVVGCADALSLVTSSYTHPYPDRFRCSSLLDVRMGLPADFFYGACHTARRRALGGGRRESGREKIAASSRTARSMRQTVFRYLIDQLQAISQRSLSVSAYHPPLPIASASLILLNPPLHLPITNPQRFSQNLLIFFVPACFTSSYLLYLFTSACPARANACPRLTP